MEQLQLQPLVMVCQGAWTTTPVPGPYQPPPAASYLTPPGYSYEPPPEYSYEPPPGYSSLELIEVSSSPLPEDIGAAPEYLYSQHLQEQQPQPSQNCERIIGGQRYRLNKIGQGTFGVLYQGENLQTKQMVAIKTESIYRPSTLDTESIILKSLQGLDGIPKWMYYGYDGRDRILMMELLGPSLHHLLKICGGKFSLKTVYMLAISLLTRLEGIHYQNILHKDIKPSNIVIGLGESAKNTYLVDFGLSKVFRHPETLQHIPPKVYTNFVGTSRFASISCHFNLETSRRDDLESLAYTLIYLLKGKLPWQGLSPVLPTKKEQFDRIRDVKMDTSACDLCRDLPIVFSQFLMYSRNLAMDAAPDYSYLKQLFNRSMTDRGIVYDYMYDWVPYLGVTQRSGWTTTAVIPDRDMSLRGNGNVIYGSNQGSLRQQGSSRFLYDPWFYLEGNNEGRY